MGRDWRPRPRRETGACLCSHNGVQVVPKKVESAGRPVKAIALQWGMHGMLKVSGQEGLHTWGHWMIKDKALEPRYRSRKVHSI